MQRTCEDLLKNTGICRRCVYRFMHDDFDSLVSAISKCSPSSTADTFVCRTCLGVLQSLDTIDAVALELSRHMTASAHEFFSFNLVVSTPVSCLLREYSMVLFLQAECPDCIKKSELIPLKEIWKFFVKAHLKHTLPVTSSVANLLEDVPLLVTVNFVYSDEGSECSFLQTVDPTHFRKREKQATRHGWKTFTRVGTEVIISKLPASVFTKHYESPPPSAVSPVTMDISVAKDCLYVGARYNKFCRRLPQTPWILDGERKMDSSVEELICGVLLQHFEADKYTFTSAGREDVDVRMLGNGRPFLVRLSNPKKVRLSSEQALQLQEQINSATSKVSIHQLQLVSADQCSVLKEGETSKRKTYSALCWSEAELTSAVIDKINSIKDLVIEQLTPVRVLHRRNLATRQKVIHSGSCRVVDAEKHLFQLELYTQAGTYIKEFVHGDLGRTQPNLGSLLGTSCDILTLDVQNVELDFPVAHVSKSE